MWLFCVVRYGATSSDAMDLGRPIGIEAQLPREAVDVARIHDADAVARGGIEPVIQHPDAPIVKRLRVGHPRQSPVAPVADRDVVLPDHLVAWHDLEAVGLEPARQREPELLVDRRQRRLQKGAAVAEIEQPYLDPSSLKMLQHVDVLV